MSSSAINSQIWNAKAANVQNADGSPIYAAGVWSFKSSTNVVTFSVSDAGVVALGGAVSSNTAGPVHLISGNLAVATPTSPSGYQSGEVLFSTNLKYATRGNRYEATLSGAGIILSTKDAGEACITFVTNADSDAVGTDATAKLTISDTGAVTLGPAAGGVAHTFRGTIKTGASLGQALAASTTIYIDVSAQSVGGLVNIQANNAVIAGNALFLIANGVLVLVSQAGSVFVSGAPSANQIQYAASASGGRERIALTCGGGGTTTFSVAANVFGL